MAKFICVILLVIQSTVLVAHAGRAPMHRGSSDDENLELEIGSQVNDLSKEETIYGTNQRYYMHACYMRPKLYTILTACMIYCSPRRSRSLHFEDKGVRRRRSQTSCLWMSYCVCKGKVRWYWAQRLHSRQERGQGEDSR